MGRSFIPNQLNSFFSRSNYMRSKSIFVPSSNRCFASYAEISKEIRLFTAIMHSNIGRARLLVADLWLIERSLRLCNRAHPDQHLLQCGPTYRARRNAPSHGLLAPFLLRRTPRLREALLCISARIIGHSFYFVFGSAKTPHLGPHCNAWRLEQIA